MTDAPPATTTTSMPRGAHPLPVRGRRTIAAAGAAFAVSATLALAAPPGCSWGAPGADRGPSASPPPLPAAPPAVAAAADEAVYPIPPEVIAVERAAKGDVAAGPSAEAEIAALGLVPPPGAAAIAAAHPSAMGARAKAARRAAPAARGRPATPAATREAAALAPAAPAAPAAVAEPVEEAAPGPAAAPPAAAPPLKKHVPLVDDDHRPRILE